MILIVLALVGVAVMFYLGNRRFVQAAERVGQAYQVMATLEELASQVSRAEAAKWEFLAEGS